PGRDRQVEIDILALDPVGRVRIEFDFKIEVARRSATNSGTSLAGEADQLAGRPTLGDCDIDLALAHAHLAALVECGAAQADGARRTLIGIGKIDEDLGVMILAAGAKLRAATTATARGATALGTTEQRFEEVAEILAFACVGAAEFEARIPARRRAE